MHSSELPRAHGGLLAACKHSFRTLQSFSSDKLEVLAFKFHNVKFILLHRHPHCDLDTFQMVLIDFIGSHPHDRTIVFGDFNVDFLKHPHSHKTSILRRYNFSQKVDFATTIYDSTIDHVWISEGLDIRVHHVETYHSDHYPLLIHVSLS
jgi:endonuclease/exonuclease/phosphatase family metal-dependent hydrolase